MTSRTPARGNSVFLLILLVLHLLVMSGSARGRDGVSRLESVGIQVTSPVVHGASWVGSRIRDFFLEIRGTWIARRENARLREDVAELLEDNSRLREYGEQNKRLRALLTMRDGFDLASVGASVVAAELTLESRLVVINRGSRAGVRNGQGILAWGGAVGRVVAVSPGYAKVRLLTDPNSGVAAIIQHNRVDGIVLGKGRENLTLAYVSRFANVALGDEVVTSGLDGIFPRGVPIGTITFVGTGNEVSRKIHVTPAVRAESLEDVLVLTDPAAGGLLPSARRGGQ